MTDFNEEVAEARKILEDFLLTNELNKDNTFVFSEIRRSLKLLDNLCIYKDKLEFMGYKDNNMYQILELAYLEGE